MNTLTIYFQAHLEYYESLFENAANTLSYCCHDVIRVAEVFNQKGELPKVLDFNASSAGFLISSIEIRLCYLNNMGCIYYKQKKYNLGCFYFEKILDIAISLDLLSVSGIANGFMRRLQLPDIIYNAGVCFLRNKCPIVALECFQYVTNWIPNQPKLYLRLSECCIMEEQLAKPDDNFYATTFQSNNSSRRRILRYLWIINNNY